MPGWKHAPGYGGRVKTLPYRENWVGVWNSWGCGSFDSLRSLRTTEERNGFPIFAVILSGGREPGVEESVPLCVVADARCEETPAARRMVTKSQIAAEIHLAFAGGFG